MSASMVAMAPDANPPSPAADPDDGDDPDDAAALGRYAATLAAAMVDGHPQMDRAVGARSDPRPARFGDRRRAGRGVRGRPSVPGPRPGGLGPAAADRHRRPDHHPPGHRPGAGAVGHPGPAGRGGVSPSPATPSPERRSPTTSTTWCRGRSPRSTRRWPSRACTGARPRPTCTWLDAAGRGRDLTRSAGLPCRPGPTAARLRYSPHWSPSSVCSNRSHPALLTDRGSKKMQPSGQLNGAWSAASTRQRWMTSPVGRGPGRVVAAVLAHGHGAIVTGERSVPRSARPAARSARLGSPPGRMGTGSR